MVKWKSYVKWCMQFFAHAGFPCPPLRNPSDHFLRCINSDFDKVKATLKGSMKLRVINFIHVNARPIIFRVSTLDSNAKKN